ncbi:MAG TPA: TRAM domain-containing protein [Candidatus Nanoarchaeia archaeon]
MDLRSLVRLIIGVAFGLFGYFAVGQLVSLPNNSIETLVSIVAGLSLGLAGVYFLPVVTEWLSSLTRTISRRVADEVISQLHLPRLPVGQRGDKSQGASEKWVNPILMDTSSLIDGRIADIIESGFVFGTVVVPDFILLELQHIADSADSLKRGRGRRGLDVLEFIRKGGQVRTVVYETGQTSLKNIDERLLRLGKNLKAKILTNDFNLNKVATVSGVKILNVNALANAMKTTLLPGEELEVKVIQEGKEKSQGVGYLPDGTMIVVENGAAFIGKKIKSKVSRVIQTVAGRMIFVQADED